MGKMTITKRGFYTVDIHAPNTGAPKSVEQILMDIKGETDETMIIVGRL